MLVAHGEHFTAGLDLVDVGPAIAEGRDPFPADGRDPWRLDGDWTKPVVAAAHGRCLTLGIELLLAADVRIAAADTRFAQIEVLRGIFPFGGATIRLPRQTGWGNAMRWLLTGDEFDAAEAHRIGLVQEVADGADAARARAVEIAHTIADRAAPLGVRATLASAHLARTTVTRRPSNGFGPRSSASSPRPTRGRACSRSSNAGRPDSLAADRCSKLGSVALFDGERREGMGHYKSNVRDLEFNLYEVLDIEKTLGSSEFGDLDAGVLAGAADPHTTASVHSDRQIGRNGP